MTLDAERQRDGARPLVVVELDLDLVTSATAATTPDGSPCYRTPATSRGFEPLTVGVRTHRFCSSSAPRPWQLDAIPCIPTGGLRQESTRLVAGSGMARLGTATVTLLDWLDDDRGEDPYFDERDPPPQPASYCGRLAARQPYMEGRAVRVGIGYATDGYDPAAIEWSHYVVRSFKRGRRGAWSLECVSPLQLMAMRDARVPRRVGWALGSDITASATTCTLRTGSWQAADPASGVLRIDDELCTFTRTDADLALSRAQQGTSAAAHTADAALQPCLYWSSAMVDIIVADILQAVGIDAGLIDTAAWAAERSTWLASYALAPQPISEPTKALDLLQELCDQVGLLLWYDERVPTIRFRALRPVAGSVATITDADLLEDPDERVDPDHRVSRCAVLYGPRSAISSLSEDSQFRARLLSQTQGEGPHEWGSVSERVLRSRWIASSGGVLAARAATTLVSALRDGRRSLRVRVGKHLGGIELGDVVTLASSALVDASGAAAGSRQLVVQRTPAADGASVELVLEPFALASRFAHVMPNDHISTYAATADEDRDPAWFLSDDDGRLPGGDIGYALG